jgi:radical SAM superfamily enzyme YgiQ (UPF0313 family)
MKKSGCEKIAFGIENADPKVFSTLKKGESLKQIKKAIKICKKNGMKVYGFFISGLPNANFQSEMKSLEFAREMKLDSCRWSLATPYWHTDLYHLVLKKGRMIQEIINKQASFSFFLKPFFETETFPFQKIKKAYIINNLRMGNYFLSFESDVFHSLLKVIELFLAILIYDWIKFPSYFFDLSKRLYKCVSEALKKKLSSFC